MATGRISTIRADTGFGFIKDSPGPKGQKVSFEAGPDARDCARVRAIDGRVVATAGT
jgi:cold shock CspA family protein